MPNGITRIEVESYVTWQGVRRITLNNGARGFNLNRDEARALRDDLTRELEEITREEEREP